MAAAYECTISCTDDETFILTLILTNTDGTVFPVNDYSFEYSAKGSPDCVLLNETDGVTKDAVTGALTITPGMSYRFKRGLYQHGLRKTNSSTGQVDQIFDGSLSVSEGNFNAG